MHTCKALLALALGQGLNAAQEPDPAGCLALMFLAAQPAQFEMRGTYTHGKFVDGVGFVKHGDSFAGEIAPGSLPGQAISFGVVDGSTIHISVAGGLRSVTEDSRGGQFAQRRNETGLMRANDHAEWIATLGLPDVAPGDLIVTGLEIRPVRSKFLSDRVPSVIGTAKLNDKGRLESIRWTPQIVGRPQQDVCTLFTYTYTDGPAFSPGLPSGWIRRDYDGDVCYETNTVRLDMFTLNPVTLKAALNPKTGQFRSRSRWDDTGEYVLVGNEWFKQATKADILRDEALRKVADLAQPLQ